MAFRCRACTGFDSHEPCRAPPRLPLSRGSGVFGALGFGLERRLWIPVGRAPGAAFGQMSALKPCTEQTPNEAPFTSEQVFGPLIVGGRPNPEGTKLQSKPELVRKVQDIAWPFADLMTELSGRVRKLQGRFRNSDQGASGQGLGLCLQIVLCVCSCLAELGVGSPWN